MKIPDIMNPPSSWTVLALTAGRYFPRLEDIIRWTVLSKAGGMKKRKRT